MHSAHLRQLYTCALIAATGGGGGGGQEGPEVNKFEQVSTIGH